MELLRDLIVREPGTDWQAPAASLHQALIAPIEQAGLAGGRSPSLRRPARHPALRAVCGAAARAGEGRAARRERLRRRLPARRAALALVRRGTGTGMAGGSPSWRWRRPGRASSSASRKPRPSPGSSRRTGSCSSAAARPRAAFKSAAGRYDVLHLATHGYFNKFNPLLSGLELEAGRRARTAGSRCTRSSACGCARGLVVLSACDTALGGGYFAEVPAGDDIVGLTRAFLFAGQPVRRRQPLGGQRPIDDGADGRVLRRLGGRRQGDGAGASAQRRVDRARRPRQPTRISGRRSCWLGR